MHEKITFINDNNVSIDLPNISGINKYKGTELKEPLHRKIISYLLNKNIIDKSKNIIDSGAWIGDNTIPWALNISGIVYAIDPSPININFIKNLAKYNNITNIKYIIKALGAEIEKISTTDDLQHCAFEKYKLKKENQIVLEAVTLDKLYQDSIIDNISFIHLDVENFEYEVLKGSKILIKKFLPIISFEQHLNEPEQPDNSIKFLKTLNYNCYIIDERLKGNRLDCRNLIAFPNTINIELKGLIKC